LIVTPSEIEAALQAAFSQCEEAVCPLSDRQKQILLQVVVKELLGAQQENPASGDENANGANPLEELTPEQIQALLQFVKEQERQNRSWKITLLNDWLNNQDSGAMQFLRDRYGFGWLYRIQPVHLAEYYEREGKQGLNLKVGDRIEVSNGLWEWVQENGPCSREWFPCTVVGVYETTESGVSHTNCIIRFENGSEYEIQGIYEWNRFNWQWPKN
jgi:hypothetical protein